VASDEWLESWRFATRAVIGSPGEAEETEEAREVPRLVRRGGLAPFLRRGRRDDDPRRVVEAGDAQDGASRRPRRRPGGAVCICIAASTLDLWDGEGTCTEVQNGCRRNSVGLARDL
jgi:hypothetical protein